MEIPLLIHSDSDLVTDTFFNTKPGGLLLLQHYQIDTSNSFTITDDFPPLYLICILLSAFSSQTTALPICHHLPTGVF